MKKLNLITALFVSFTYTVHVHAEEDPLAKTQQILLDQKAREDVLATDQKAKAADDFANKTVNGNAQDKEKLYQLASEALTHLSNKHGGDVGKMQKEIEQAIKQPDQFRDSLPPELVKQMEDLAHKVENNKMVNRD